MTAHVKVLLFLCDPRNPIDDGIAAKTRDSHVHAAFWLDCRADGYPELNLGPGHLIYEEYEPHCRYRILADSELSLIDVRSIKDWTDDQDRQLREYIARREHCKIPYWAMGLALFDPAIRALHGEATAQDWFHHAFCSHEVFRLLLECGKRVLQGADYDKSPRDLAMSTELPPEPALVSLSASVGEAAPVSNGGAGAVSQEVKTP